jgi:hypothetical protein
MLACREEDGGGLVRGFFEMATGGVGEAEVGDVEL